MTDDNSSSVSSTKKSSTKNNTAGSSYAEAGVNIAAGQQLVEQIKPFCKATARAEVVGNIGGFGGLFRIPAGYQSPLLVSATDGVGTKLRLAIDYDQLAGIGIDCVAMCVNDLIVCGAEPLFFLDYYATGQLDVAQATTVIESVATGCQQAGCALIGGETAEMPGFYPKNDFDIAGFSIGIVEEAQIIDGKQITAGDQLIGIASSGAHANGFSLIRRIIADNQIDPSYHQLTDPISTQQNVLLEALLQPTRIYVKTILSLKQQFLPNQVLKGIAHITGGGLTENLPRILPDHLRAAIDTRSWQRPALFSWLQSAGEVSEDEMWRTFNCGVGLVLVVKATQSDAVLTALAKLGETAWLLGTITEIDTIQTNSAQVIFH